MGYRPANELVLIKRQGRQHVAKLSERLGHEFIRPHDDTRAVVGGKDHDPVGERQDPLVQAPIEIVRERFRLIGEIRSTHALKEQGVASKYGVFAQLVHRRTLRVAWHAHRGHRQLDARRQLDSPSIGQRFKFKRKGVSAATSAYLQALLVPNVLIADLSQNVSTASYLGWESGGQINPSPNTGTACSVTPNKFGGRGLSDDVVDVTFGLVFGNTASRLAATPNVSAPVPADDGNELNGSGGTPNLTTDNVNCSAAPTTPAQFPYLANPL